jgi:hypothetical protein
MTTLWKNNKYLVIAIGFAIVLIGSVFACTPTARFQGQEMTETEISSTAEAYEEALARQVELAQKKYEDEVVKISSDTSLTANMKSAMLADLKAEFEDDAEVLDRAVETYNRDLKVAYEEVDAQKQKMVVAVESIGKTITAATSGEPTSSVISGAIASAILLITGGAMMEVVRKEKVIKKQNKQLNS